MATLLAVMSFAAVYAASAVAVNRISVYWLGFWDPKFVDQAGNVAVADEVLPVFVALATLSFLVGLSIQRTTVGRSAAGVVAAVGAASGLIAAVLLLAEPGLLHLGVHAALAGVIGMAAFWAGPAVVGTVGFGLVRRRSQSDAV